jgi:hypothetical protein
LTGTPGTGLSFGEAAATANLLSRPMRTAKVSPLAVRAAMQDSKRPSASVSVDSVQPAGRLLVGTGALCAKAICDAPTNNAVARADFMTFFILSPIPVMFAMGALNFRRDSNRMNGPIKRRYHAFTNTTLKYMAKRALIA